MECLQIIRLYLPARTAVREPHTSVTPSSIPHKHKMDRRCTVQINYMVTGCCGWVAYVSYWISYKR